MIYITQKTLQKKSIPIAVALEVIVKVTKAKEEKRAMTAARYADKKVYSIYENSFPRATFASHLQYTIYLSLYKCIRIIRKKKEKKKDRKRKCELGTKKKEG